MMEIEYSQNKYQDYDERVYQNNYKYSPENHDQRVERERTRDRERRRERRRRERERDRDREYRNDDDRDRSRHRSREQPNDHDDRSHGGSVDYDDEGSNYEYGEGFYEEGGYIDHPTHGNQNDYSNKYSRDFGRDRDRDRDRDRGGDRWMTDTPTNTILLRGLPSTVDEKDIKAELMLFGAPVKDVRLMKRKDTGASRGFAFVEFQNLIDAERWMDQNQGEVLVLNQYRVKMYFSTPKNTRSGDSNSAIDRQQSDWQRTDWTCSKCGYHNFRRRDHCFKCSTTREESDRAKEGDGFDQVGNNPCNTLIFRGLDALTMEENIITALSTLTSIPVKNMKVLRDELTGTSRGFGFAEFNTLAESSQVLSVLQSLPSPFEVDGKAIIVSYAKNTFSTVMATMGAWSQPAAQPTTYDYTAYYDANSGQYYDPVTGQYYDYATYYAHQQQLAADGSITQTQTDSANAAAAVAQAAIQQAQAAKQSTKTDTLSTATTTSTAATLPVEYPQYPTPDVSTYQYEESSGYYYDPSTGLYYDANSQYYYNSTTNQFMYWDGERKTYLPAPNQEQAANTANEHKTDDKKKGKKEEKKDKVKVAKRIAKDMAKWAKTLNAQKEAIKDGFKKSMQMVNAQRADKESASADAGFAILEKVKAERSAEPLVNQEQSLMPPPPLPEGDQPGLVASYGGDSDDDDGGGNDDDHDLEKLLDWSKMACLLCKRQFPNKDALQRHQQLSDLHKKNLENMKKSKDDMIGGQYRDRAKERRAKYGRPEPPVPKKSLQTTAMWTL